MDEQITNEVDLRLKVEREVEWLSVNLIALAIELGSDEITQDCRHYAKSADDILPEFKRLVAANPSDYASVSHRINGLSNTLTLGISVLQYAAKTAEHRQWQAAIWERSEALLALLKQFVVAYDPTKAAVVGHPLNGVDADPRRPLRTLHLAR